MDAEALDLSKENIQPLRRGRNVSMLCTALQAESDWNLQHQLMQERDQFEILIRSYSGDDPLSVWYDYVQWVEQHFPKHGLAGNLQKLLEKCLIEFRESEEYSQDVRYIDLWITYMGFSKNPLELYRQIHSHGIGTECALFYQCWAEEYEKTDDIKRADQVYLEGIKRKAHPIESLESAHNDFQIRVARSILGNESHVGNENVREHRSALSTLRAHGRKKNMVDNARVGNSIQRPTPGILRPLHNATGPEGRNSNTKQSSKIKVFYDENEVSDAVPSGKVKPVGPILERDQNKENSLKPGPWNGVKLKQKNKFSSEASGRSGPVFQVHEDADAAFVKSCEVYSSSALKNRKEHLRNDSEVPLFIPEPPDPTKRVMYQKKKVYSGGTEFSFEELRAIVHESLKKRKSELSKKALEKEQISNEEAENGCNSKNSTDNCIFQKDTEDPVYKVNLKGDNYEVNTNQQEKYLRSESQNISLSKVASDGENEPSFGSAIGPAKGTVPLPFTFYEEDTEEMNIKLKPKLHTTRKSDTEKMPPPKLRGPSISSLPYTGLLKVPKLINRQSLAVNNQAAAPLPTPPPPPPSELPQTGPVENDQSFTIHTKQVLDMMFLSPSAACSKQTGIETRSPAAGSQRSVQRVCGKTFNDSLKHFNACSESEMENCGVAQVNVYVPPRSERVPVPVFCSESSCMDIRSEDACNPGSRGAGSSSSPLYKKFEIYTDTSVQQNIKAEVQDFLPIPFIASPGMSKTELDALEGTDNKENLPVNEEKSNKCPSRRTVTGVLQPAKDIPCEPLEEQIEVRGEGNEGNTLSDVTCCTEAFKLPLVSSTPCVSHQWPKAMPKEEPQMGSCEIVPRSVEQDSSGTINERSQKSMVTKKKSCEVLLSVDQSDSPCIESFCLEKVPNQGALSVNVENTWSYHNTPKSRLSTITEISYRTSLSSGASSGASGAVSTQQQSSPSKNDPHHAPFLHRRSQDRHHTSKHSLTWEGINPQSSIGSVDFYLNDFRNTRVLPNSNYVKLNCRAPTFDDVVATRTLILGTDKYNYIDNFETNDRIYEVLATDILKRKVIIGFNNTCNLWPLYIREAIKKRSTHDMIGLWPEVQKVYVFEDCCVSVSDFTQSSNVDETANMIRLFQQENVSESMVQYLISKMFEVVHLLHKNHIIHGSLTSHKFRISCSGQTLFVFLTDFEEAIDLMLLPKEIKFSVSHSKRVHFPELYTPHLSGYQVDCITLAISIYPLIFSSPLEIEQMNGKWVIKNAFPRPCKEGIWMHVFTELLNAYQPDLLKLSRILQENVTENTELEIIRVINIRDQ